MNDTCLIRARRVVVRKDRIRFDVCVAPGAPRYMTPAIADRLRVSVPSLAMHSCVSEAGTTFGAVMDTTSLPHVLEHLIIDAQVHDQTHRQNPKQGQTANKTANSVFVGTTEWLDETAGLARIEISYTDDMVALRAFADAKRRLEQAVLPWRL